MIHAVIMAGGAGTRFWPASRTALPKQLLKLLGDRTMIQATVDRLGDLVPSDRLLVVTNRQIVSAIAAQLPEVPRTAIIGEPCKRDTAPCIGLAAAINLLHDEDATMVVLPADHVIQPADSFRQIIRKAVDLVEEQPSRIITFGIPPAYPAEIYGYIQRGAALPGGDSSGAVFQVQRFREKPSLEVAREFVADGGFYWNSGIFVWKAKTIMEALQRFEPAMHAHLVKIAESLRRPSFEQVLDREFAAIVGKSVDYAIMERYEDVLVVEAPFQWDDVGNWNALQRLRGEDEQGNTIDGKHLGISTSGSIIRAEGDHLIVTVGIEDLIVVHTDDATLVARKRDEEKLRQVVEQLRQRGWEEYL